MGPIQQTKANLMRTENSSLEFQENNQSNKKLPPKTKISKHFVESYYLREKFDKHFVCLA